ncbi:MAG: hypothetical protein PHX62_00520 [Bacilli bacterium]|nr:hypothetical protein [Bacilli bacterium]
MKTKKFIILMLLFLLIFLTSCKSFFTLRDLEKKLQEFDKIVEMDVSYTMEIEVKGQSAVVHGIIIAKEIDNVLCSYVKTQQGFYFTEYYIFGDYQCDSNHCSLSQTSNDTPDITVNIIGTEVSKEQEDDKIVYTVETNDAANQKFVEELLGGELDDYTFNILIKYTFSKETEILEQTEMVITLKDEVADNDITVTLLLNYNKFGDDVVLEIPYQISLNFETYLEEHNITYGQVIYEDSENGVVKYHYLEDYDKIIYDEYTNKLIVINNNYIYIYNADNMAFLSEFKLSGIPITVDVNQGKLVAGYTEPFFEIYDLIGNADTKRVQTEINVYEIVIDGDMIIYSDSQAYGKIYFYNNLTEERFSKQISQDPLLTIDHKNHILFTVDRSSYYRAISAYNTQTGEFLFKTAQNYPDKCLRPYDNGKYLLFGGFTYNKSDGESVSNSYLCHKYKRNITFEPVVSLYYDDKISFIGSKYSKNTVAIYDNQKDAYTCLFSMDYGEIIKMKNDKFVATSRSKKFIAFIDVN